MQHMTELTPNPLETPVTKYVGMVNELWLDEESIFEHKQRHAWTGPVNVFQTE